MAQCRPDAIHHRDRVGVPTLLHHRKIHRRLTVVAYHVGLNLLRIFGIAEVGDAHRRLPHHLDRKIVDVRHRAQLAIRVDVVIQRPKLHIARRQNQVRVVDGAHHVHGTQLVGFQLVGVGIDHDLAVRPAERLRHAGARNTADLVADLKLRHVAQRGLIHPCALEGDQAHRQARSVQFQYHWGQSAGRQPAQLRHRQIRDRGDGRVRIRAGLKEYLNHAHTGQGAGFDMLDAGAQREEPLEAAGDIVLDLLRRHARVKGGYRHYRDVHRREHIDGHASQAGNAHHRDEQANHDNEIRITDSKTGHSQYLLGQYPYLAPSPLRWVGEVGQAVPPVTPACGRFLLAPGPPCYIVVALGRTSCPACSPDLPLSTTVSPSFRPESTSILCAVSSPSEIFRTSTRLFGVMTITRPDFSPSVSTAITGTTRTALWRLNVRLTSAYMPGIRIRLAFGTSTSVSMVRVASDNLPEKRATLPGKLRFSVGTRTSTCCPICTVGTADSGTGRISRSRLFSEIRTTGMACVCEAVPAWIIEPLSAYRLVITPVNGAVTRV